MKNKGGQLTIFIILAILIVAGVVMFFVFRGNAENSNQIPLEVEPINNYVLSCLEDTASKGIQEVYGKGGYYPIKNNLLFEYFTEDFSFYYNDLVSSVPTIQVVEESLNNYVFENVGYCLNFSNFEEQGYKIDTNELHISSRIRNGIIKVGLDYPMGISYGEFSTGLKNFDIEINSNIEDILELSNKIIFDYSLNPGIICLSCLGGYSEDTGFRVYTQVIPDDENIYLFTISDNLNDLGWRFVVGE